MSDLGMNNLGMSDLKRRVRQHTLTRAPRQ